MATKSFTKDDRVWKQMKKNLRKAGQQIKTGWFEGQNYGQENNFLPMAQVAKWVEEGHRGGWGPTPARPAIRMLYIPTIADSGFLVQQGTSLVKSVAEGKMSWKTLHTKLAPKVLYKFKLTLESYYKIPNSKATVEYKGFNDPWRETGTLVENARFVVDSYKSVGKNKTYTIFQGPLKVG